VRVEEEEQRTWIGGKQKAVYVLARGRKDKTG
jgi:hypothetical protein